MKEIVDYLSASGFQYLATIGLDGSPKVRPFQFMFEERGKFWFCTSNQKEVFKELSANPNLELCASGSPSSWLRLQGTVVFSSNIEIKTKIMEQSALVKGIYKEPNNPEFEVFYLKNFRGVINEFGKEARSFCAK